MNEKEVWRNARLFGGYQMLCQPLFWGPTLILYLQQAGCMSLSEVYLMEAAVMALDMLMQIPTGALADQIGRKNTMLIGSLFYLAGITVMCFVDSRALAWLSNILVTLAYVMYSGADTALLYDSLKEIGEEKQYGKVLNRAIGKHLLAASCCSLIAGFASEIDIRLPFFMSVPGMIVCIVVISRMKEPIKTRRFNLSRQLSLMREGVLFAAQKSKVKWIIGFSIFAGLAVKIAFFTYNPYFQAVNLSLKYYGLAFAAMQFAGWLISRKANLIEEKLGEFCSVALLVFLTALPILVMGTFVSVLSISMAVILSAVYRGMANSFSSHFLNRHLESENRATVSSVKSAAGSLAQIVFLALFGLVLGIVSLPVSLQFLGLAALVFGGVGIIHYRSVFK